MVCLAAGGLIVYGIWAFNLPVSMAPDEAMRYDIPYWIWKNHALPNGDEMELIHPIWGFSYGFTPYLPSLLSVFFMEIMSFFTESSEALIFAARIPSVLAGTGTLIFSMLIGEEFFEGKTEKYLYTVLVGFLPQVAFVSAYLNNDGFAVFTCSWILYAWIRGIKQRWSYKNCLFLAIGISLCALTYYNAYGYILCSVFVFAGDILTDEKLKHRWKYFFSHGFFIAGVVFALAGWFFVRNFIIHNGDFLGMKSMYACGELYAMEDFKPSNRQTRKALGATYAAILLNGAWLRSTLRSFIAGFGYMNVFTNTIVYWIYYAVYIVGIGTHCVKAALFYQKKERVLLFGSAWLCILIPFMLSVHYSYAIDYQAQGRYVLSCLPGLMLIITSGYETLGEYLGKRGSKVLKVGVISLLVILFGYVYLTCGIKQCWGGIAA